MVRRLTVLAVLLSFVLALAGCDTATQAAPGNTTLSGAAIGGLSGAGIGALASKNHGKGALVGGLVGTAGGAIVGNQMEQNRNRAMMQQQQVQGAYNQGYVDAQGPLPPPPPPRSY